MSRQIFNLLFVVQVFCSCGDPRKQSRIENDSISIPKLDKSITNSNSYKNEQDYLKRKRILCNRLALYDNQKATDSLELRMWLIPSFWDPSILYILKGNGSQWTLFHYQIYMQTATSQDHYYDDPVIEYFNNPLVDSVAMESVRPQKTNWQTYISNLQLDSLWNLQTESSIKGTTFAMLDGYRCLLELSEKGRYKYLFFTAPDYFQNRNINHKEFTEFQKRLVEPIIYKGMRNP